MQKPNAESIKRLKDVVTRPIPQEQIKMLNKGFGKPLAYISGSTCIDQLNEAFNYLWSWEDVKTWVTDSLPKLNKKTDQLEDQPPVAHVIGRLTALMVGEDGELISISKTSPGCQAFYGGQNEQENVWKGASTDAMKKAASKFGIGLELARSEEEQALFDAMHYESPWTDDALAAHQEEFDYVRTYMTEQTLADDDLNRLVQEFSGNTLYSFDELLPDVLPGFVDWLKSIVEEQLVDGVMKEAK